MDGAEPARQVFYIVTTQTTGHAHASVHAELTLTIEAQSLLFGTGRSPRIRCLKAL